MEFTKENIVSKDILLKAFHHMMIAKATAAIYEENSTYKIPAHT